MALNGGPRANAEAITTAAAQAGQAIDAAVDALRSCDGLMPLERRRVVAALDDVGARFQLMQVSLQRLAERSQGPAQAPPIQHPAL